MNYASQLRAAQRAHDNTCDCCGPEPDNEQAIAAYAAQLVREDEVEALVLELYDASNAILSALSQKPQTFATTTFVQRLRRLVQSVEAA